MATVRVEQFTDPFSPWCWAAQPALRRLRYEFDDVAWTPRMTVLLPDSPPDPLPGRADDVDDRRRRFAQAAAATGMPVADDLWAGGLPSSRLACGAVAFVRGTAPELALAVLRRLQEAAFADGRTVDDPVEVASVAGEVPGIEPDVVRRALEDGRAADALEADLERGVDVADELGDVDVRGDVSTLPVAGRLSASSRASSAAASAEDVEGGGDAESDSDADGNGAEGAEGGSDADGDESSNEDSRADEPTLLGPPVLRVDRGPSSVTVVDPRLPYGRLATAFGRSVPQTGIEIDDKYATSRMAMHVSRDVAESLSSQDFAGEVRPYLAYFGSAYLPEVVAGTGVSRDTCLAALETLVSRGEAERVGPAKWRTVDEPGAPGRGT